MQEALPGPFLQTRPQRRVAVLSDLAIFAAADEKVVSLFAPLSRWKARGSERIGGDKRRPGAAYFAFFYDLAARPSLPPVTMRAGPE